jgi:hypothetical protein
MGTFITAGHEALFKEPEGTRCDVCSEAVDPNAGDEGFAVPGRGLYMWTRGSEVRFEEPHLCASCGAAIGMSALARWEAEEEEG